jgi:hypothetical protein
MRNPSTNIAGVVTRRPRSGSRPVSVQSAHVMNAERMMRAPWATLITSMTPKMSVRPEARSA